MKTSTIWPPPPKYQTQGHGSSPHNRNGKWILWLLFPGIAVGIFDITQSGDAGDFLLGGLAFLLGILHPKIAWLHAILICIGLFLVHVVAVICGVRHPYVENNLISTLYSFYSLIPAFICAYLGAALRFLLYIATYKKQ